MKKTPNKPKEEHRANWKKTKKKRNTKPTQKEGPEQDKKEKKRRSAAPSQPARPSQRPLHTHPARALLPAKNAALNSFVSLISFAQGGGGRLTFTEMPTPSLCCHGCTSPLRSPFYLLTLLLMGLGGADDARGCVSRLLLFLFLFSSWLWFLLVVLLFFYWWLF